MLHTYVMKSNAISTFSVTGSTAQFTAKASIYDITTGASVDGGALMNVVVCGANSSCPNQYGTTSAGSFTAGPDGAIGIQINNSKTGGAWFSSSWTGAYTVPQNAVTGSVSVTQ